MANFLNLREHFRDVTFCDLAVCGRSDYNGPDDSFLMTGIVPNVAVAVYYLKTNDVLVLDDMNEAKEAVKISDVHGLGITVICPFSPFPDEAIYGRHLLILIKTQLMRQVLPTFLMICALCFWVS